MAGGDENKYNEADMKLNQVSNDVGYMKEDLKEIKENLKEHIKSSIERNDVVVDKITSVVQNFVNHTNEMAKDIYKRINEDKEHHEKCLDDFKKEVEANYTKNFYFKIGMVVVGSLVTIAAAIEIFVK